MIHEKERIYRLEEYNMALTVPEVYFTKIFKTFSHLII